MSDDPHDPDPTFDDSVDDRGHDAGKPALTADEVGHAAHDPIHLTDPTEPFDGTHDFDDQIDDLHGNLDDDLRDGLDDDSHDDLHDGLDDNLGSDDVGDPDPGGSEIRLEVADSDTSDDDLDEDRARNDADPHVRDADDTASHDGSGVDEVVLDDGPEASFESAFDPAQLSSLMADLSVDPADVVNILERMGLDQAPDGRCLVIAFEQLGVEARVEFSDLDRVADLLAAGVEVRLGDAGAIVAIDDVTDEATLMLGGDEYRVPLAELDIAWAEHANEMILAENDGRLLAVLPALHTEDGGISG